MEVRIMTRTNLISWLALFLLPWTLFSGSALAQTEYKPKAKRTLLVKTALAGMEGREANLLHLEFPPGWISEKHFHSGHVFVYVLEGSVTFDVKGKAPRTVGAGGVYHELPNEVMQITNTSATDGLKVILFQVGKEGKPLMIKAE